MSQRIGPIKKALSSAKGMQIGMSLWPPYLASGIRVEHISTDFHRARVRLDRRPWNTNYVGTAFGGSLFAMSDPFWMFLLMRKLGSDYVVWDVAGEIDFLSPGLATVHAEFVVTDQVVADIRNATAGGKKTLRWFTTELTDNQGKVIARVRKQIYIRCNKTNYTQEQQAHVETHVQEALPDIDFVDSCLNLAGVDQRSQDGAADRQSLQGPQAGKP